jgi:N-acetylgalactosamine-6-sulfatase
MAVLLAAAGSSPEACFQEASSKPNVVLVLADDLGYGDLGCTGHPYARTPALDGLAREGTLFRQFTVAGITCCPSRTGFMTGKFPAAFQKYPADFGFGDRVTVTELLKKAGYATGHFGKWHIGPARAPGTYGLDAVGDEAPPERKKGERGRDSPIFDDALRFIEQNRNRPFYVNVWGHISHFPVNPVGAFVERFRDLKVDESALPESLREKFEAARKLGGDPEEGLRRYLADVHSLDEDVGRLLRKIDELGLRERTVVVFSSDHGPSGPDQKPDGNKAELRMNMMGSAGPLRGGKHGMYEGGVRVPFLVRWPGHVPAGRVNEKAVLSGVDWLPTICRIAGVAVKAADFDGEDVSDLWKGAERERSRPLFWKTSVARSPIGVRDGPWKLHHPNRKKGDVELYDLSADPGERRNVAADHPDVVKRLSALAEQWSATLPREYAKGPSKDDE